jgi:GT2 family glycosyltransferase
MKASVGIVIPFYNGHKYLKELMESVAVAGRDFSCKVFIIDNSPENMAIEPGADVGITVEIIREKPGIGYGKACNRGFELCRKEGFDYIIISNQDGYFSRDMIRNLLNPFEKDESIFIAAPMLKVYGDNKIEDFFIKYYLSQIPEMVSDVFSGSVRDYYEMKVISGACFALRNDMQYPYPYLFDPVFHMYFEDEDLCRRVGTISRKIVLVPREADFYHQHSHTTDLENRDTIVADRLLGEKIFQLKDPRKSIIRALYGIFVSTSTAVLYHLLRGEGRALFMQIRTSFDVLLKVPRIMRTKKEEASENGIIHL